ncbi:MAG: N-6 DNA methylase [Christensenellales bacterium]
MDGALQDEKGFCAIATTEQIAAQDYILTPGRYVGIQEQQDDGEPFEEKCSGSRQSCPICSASPIRWSRKSGRNWGRLGMTFDSYTLGEVCSFIDYRGKTPRRQQQEYH